MSETWRKYVNTIMLSIIMLFVSIGVPVLVSIFNKVSDKVDTLMLTVAVHNSDAELWKNKIDHNRELIEALINGNVEATKDRITREEAMAAIDDLKNWVDKYYARK